MNLYQYQNEVFEWSRRNFPNNTSVNCFLGIVEEVGELSHIILKNRQNIREGINKVKSKEMMEDALGDILIYILDFAARSDIDLEYCLQNTWAVVKLRDWIKFPKNGRTE